MDLNPECYVDTSALIAFLDRADSYHPVYVRLFSAPPKLVTSALVIAEGHGWFLRKNGVRRAAQFLVFIKSLKPLIILPFGPEQVETAQPLLAKFGDQALTLADAHGLAIMRARKIKTCWSTDRHLSLMGAHLPQ